MHDEIEIANNPFMARNYKDIMRKALEMKGLSMKQASLQAGLSDTYLRGVLERGRDPTVANFLKVAKVLELSPKVLFDDEMTNDKIRKSDVSPSELAGPIGKIDADLLVKLMKSIEETRRKTKIAIGGKTIESNARFLADMYNIVIDAGGDFDAVRHFIEIETLDDDEQD